MAVNTPDTSAQVEARMKIDVQAEAPDSNPYLKVHWLRSLIAGIALRIFDFYQDLRVVEERIFPDTTDDDQADKWGEVFIGARNAATPSTGTLIASGAAGGSIPIGTTLSVGSVTLTVTAGDIIAADVISISSMTRVGDQVTVITSVAHELSSSTLVSITGATETEYNVTDQSISVTDDDAFVFTIVGTPTSPATGTPQVDVTRAVVTVQSDNFGSGQNLEPDTPVALDSPIVNVVDTLHVTFGGISGGADTESTEDYVDRYLDKIRNPVAHFNAADIEAKAREVTGVTRVWVLPSSSPIGVVNISSMTRNGNVATAITSAPHDLPDGGLASVAGFDQNEYNVTDARIIQDGGSAFHFVVQGNPATPATGSGVSFLKLAIGQVRIYFVRDNDTSIFPSAPEIAEVQAAIDTIVPANTPLANVVVLAPTPKAINFTLSALNPNTASVRAAVLANLQQFFAEQVSVGEGIEEDAYRCAIFDSVVPETGQKVISFELTEPVGDVGVAAGELPVLGTFT